MPDLNINNKLISQVFFIFFLKMQLPVMQDNPSKYHQQPVATAILSNIGEVTMYAIVWSDRI